MTLSYSGKYLYTVGVCEHYWPNPPCTFMCSILEKSPGTLQEFSARKCAMLTCINSNCNLNGHIHCHQKQFVMQQSSSLSHCLDLPINYFLLCQVCGSFISALLLKNSKIVQYNMHRAMFQVAIQSTQNLYYYLFFILSFLSVFVYFCIFLFCFFGSHEKF